MNILKVVKCRGVNVQKENERYAMTLDDNAEQVHLQMDLIINSSGTVVNTTSSLINNLRGRLPINEERWGFNVDEKNMVHRFFGLFLVGPLLNHSFSGKQVESISAAFGEGDVVANALFGDLSGHTEQKTSEAMSAA